MNIKNIHLVYFSATYTTRKTVREIARIIGGKITEHDITCGGTDGGIAPDSPDDLLIVGAPVYAGRIPETAAEALKRLKGRGNPAIAVCVYGNRDYDDALLELSDITGSCGFKVFAAGAFIGRHSIFPKVAAGRPDADDMKKIEDFAMRCTRLLAGAADTAQLTEPDIKGNRPYRQPGNVPLRPKGDRKTCTMCRTCVRLCPAGAIPADSPCDTDTGRCIACGRCIVVCPQHSRDFRGMIYKMAGMKFVRANSARREPDTFF